MYSISPFLEKLFLTFDVNVKVGNKTSFLYTT